MTTVKTASFAPILIIPSGIRDISFYQKGMGAVELRRWANDDGSIHVAELEIAGNLFHLHEENPAKGTYAPQQHKGITATIGLIVDDVDEWMALGLAAGATLRSPAQDFEYGYRQGEIVDPFGHRWMFEKII